jgi:hypothetical protein
VGDWESSRCLSVWMTRRKTAMAMRRRGNGPIDIMCLAQNIVVTAGELAPHAGRLNTVRRTVRVGYYKARAWLEQAGGGCLAERLVSGGRVRPPLDQPCRARVPNLPKTGGQECPTYRRRGDRSVRPTVTKAIGVPACVCSKTQRRKAHLSSGPATEPSVFPVH